MRRDYIVYFMKISQPIIYLLTLGLVVRIAISLYSLQFRENTDILRWRDWGRITYLYSLKNTYTTDHISFGTLPNNMPPGTLYIVSGMYMANNYTNRVLLKILSVKEGTFHWMNGTLPNFFLRIPSLIADCIIAFLIYRLIKNRSTEKNAIMGMSLFFFNPVILYNSSLWGQMDSINNLFFFACLFSIFKKRFVFGLIFYALSLYIKLSLLFALPFILIILFKSYKNNIFSFLKSMLITMIAILAFTLPISSNPISWVTKYLTTNSTGEMQNISAFAFNFWWFIFHPTIGIGKPLNNFEFSEIRLFNSPLSDNIFFGVPLSFLGYILFSILVIPFFVLIIKNRISSISPGYLLLLFSVVGMIAFLFLPRMHERYMYPIFPLLAASIGLGAYKYLRFYYIFSLLNLINLYLVWHPTLPPLIPYGIMINNNFQWLISAITIGIFILFYRLSIKTLFYHEA